MHNCARLKKVLISITDGFRATLLLVMHKVRTGVVAAICASSNCICSIGYLSAGQESADEGGVGVVCFAPAQLILESSQMMRQANCVNIVD